VSVLCAEHPICREVHHIPWDRRREYATSPGMRLYDNKKLAGDGAFLGANLLQELRQLLNDRRALAVAGAALRLRLL